MFTTRRRCGKKKIEGVILMLRKILVYSYYEYFMQLSSLHLHQDKVELKKVQSIEMRDGTELNEEILKRLQLFHGYD